MDFKKGDSVTRDWNLVCEREGMKATVGAAPMAGYLVGKYQFLVAELGTL